MCNSVTVAKICCFITVLICFVLSAVTEAGKAGDSLAEDFFREEYILNNAIGELYDYTCIIDYIC